MIKTLRKRFIRIAMLAVTAVLLALCLIVNAANYISVDNSLTNMLQIISNNRGMVPQSPPAALINQGPDRKAALRRKPPFPPAILSCGMMPMEPFCASTLVK